MQFDLLTILAIIYTLLVVVSIVYYYSITIGTTKITLNINKKKASYEPFVSIIVPTYNEENNIVRCLHSLRSLNYTNYEIILSDGGSSDQTVKLAKPFVDKLIIDETLPPGWIGKNWGCHLGYKEAKGELLLFTDADTSHKPNSLKIFVDKIFEQRADLLSLMPFQELEHIWESFVPINFFLSHVLSGGPKKVNNPNKTNSFVAIGQYLLFTRTGYDSIGGHESIKGSIIEDYAFARVVKQELGSLFFIINHKLVYARMYPESPRHCWNGFKKCLYPGTKLTPGYLITITLIYVFWGLLSPVAITLTAVYGDWISITLAIAAYLAYLLIFFSYWNNKGKHYWFTYLFFPFLLLIFLIAILVSTLEFLITKTTSWKGRIYTPDLSAGLSKGKSKQKKNTEENDREKEPEIILVKGKEHQS